jgi:hypothetical protein
MLQQLSYDEFTGELARRKDAKRDYLADTSLIEVDYLTNPKAPKLNVGGAVGQSFSLSFHAQKQISTRLRVPWRYYQRMQRDHPDILETNVNGLLHREPETRMLRTLDGKARAFLSPRFRRLDDDQLAAAVLPLFDDLDIDIEDSTFALTNTSMIMKVVSRGMEREVRKGDAVRSGLVISNSEVGAGKLRVMPLIYRLVCSNGLVAGKAIGRMERKHLGPELSIPALAGELPHPVGGDDDLWADVIDLTKKAADQQVFDGIVGRMAGAAQRHFKIEPTTIVDRIGGHHRLAQSEREGIAARLLSSGDHSLYGVVNAFTRYAQDVDSYERSTELEEVAGELLEMPQSKWEKMAMKAA